MSRSLHIPGPVGKLEAKLMGLSSDPKVHHNTIGIICHPHPLYQGTMDNKVVTTTAKVWQELEIPVILFNFRGVGESEGQYGGGIGEIQDLHAVIHWLSKNYQYEKLWLGGFSFGAAVAYQVTNENRYPISSLLTIAPPVNHFDFVSEAHILCPWILVQGDQDEIVPIQEVDAMVKTLQEKGISIKYLVMPQATHFFHHRLVDLKDLILTAMNNNNK